MVKRALGIRFGLCWSGLGRACRPEGWWGANVRRHRQLKNMTQEQLALEAGMERSYVSDLERGTRNPSVRALGRLADAFGIEPKTLLETSPPSA